jgi:hypothetical protein
LCCFAEVGNGGEVEANCGVVEGRFESHMALNGYDNKNLVQVSRRGGWYLLTDNFISLLLGLYL